MTTVARVIVILLALWCSACSGDDETSTATTSYSERGLTFDYPQEWSRTSFSTTNEPRRLAVASYDIPNDSVEGDCAGIAAIQLLRVDGTLVLLIDYGDGPGFDPLPADVDLGSGKFANYDCIGESAAFMFRVGEHDVQVHLAFGPETSDEDKQRALHLLRSIAVDS